MTELESLALLTADLYGQVRALQTENEELRKHLAGIPNEPVEES